MPTKSNVTVFLDNGIKFSFHLRYTGYQGGYGLKLAKCLNENTFCNPGCLLSKILELETPILQRLGDNDILPCADINYTIKMVNNKIFIDCDDFVGSPEDYIEKFG